MKSRIIDYNRRQKRRKSKASLHTEADKAIKSLIITLTSMILVLLVVYFIVSNENAQRGYTLEQEKLQNEYLKTENSNITTKITQSTAFTKIQETEATDSMTTNSEKTYVTKEDITIN